MSPEILNALSVGWVASLLGLYSLLIGFGVQAAIAGYVRFPRSLGLTAGIGLSLTSLLMVYSHRLFEKASLPIIPLAVMAAVVLALRFYFARPLNIWRPPVSDVWAAAITVLLMLPVLHFGLTFWTEETNDFPSYASSAEIWLNSRDAFAEKHQDNFGALQLLRATYEKPMVTALLVLTSKLSSLPPYQVLSPVLAVLIFIGSSSLIIALSAAFRISSFVAGLAIILPSFSVVSVSRLYHAQPGHIAAVCLIACLLAVLITAKRQKGGILPVAALAGVVGAATIGSNFTLIAGSGIVLGATFVWMFAVSGEYAERMKLAVLGGAFTLIFSAPLAQMYLVSLSNQTGGVQGYDIPFASPLSLIGQQISLLHVAPDNQVLLSWIILMVIVLAVLWSRKMSISNFSFDVFLILAIIVNAMIVGLKLGWNNYSTHKWLAVFIAASGPIFVGYAVSLTHERRRIAAIALLIPLAVSSIFFGLRSADIRYAIDPDLLALRTNQALADQEAVNIRLGDWRLNSTASLIIPAKRVAIVEGTYAPASLPVKGMTLVRRDFADENNPETVLLNSSYALVPTYQPAADSLRFTSDSPSSQSLLFGSWYASESWGTWGGRGDNYVTLAPPPGYAGGNLVMSVTGTAYTPKGTPQSIEIIVNDEPIMTVQFPRADQRFDFGIPSRLAESGRLMINFRAAGALSPSDYGAADKRTLGFGLTSLSISPAE